MIIYRQVMWCDDNGDGMDATSSFLLLLFLSIVFAFISDVPLVIVQFGCIDGDFVYMSWLRYRV